MILEFESFRSVWRHIEAKKSCCALCAKDTFLVPIGYLEEPEMVLNLSWRGIDANGLGA